jgi:hypothetical protein
MELAYQVQLVTVLLHLAAAEYQGDVACPALTVPTVQYSCFVIYLPMPMAAQSTGLGLRPLGFLGLWVQFPPWALMSVSCERCVLPGRGLYVGPITHSEESYRVCAWH